MYKLVNGERVEMSDEDILKRQQEDEKYAIEKENEAYKEQRLMELPPIKEQLDMIYHDQINGTTNWLDLITSIKAKYPKSR